MSKFRTTLQFKIGGKYEDVVEAGTEIRAIWLVYSQAMRGRNDQLPTGLYMVHVEKLEGE